jgi:hypothetical protein
MHDLDDDNNLTLLFFLTSDVVQHAVREMLGLRLDWPGPPARKSAARRQLPRSAAACLAPAV